MFSTEFSNKIKISKKNGESIGLDQRRVKIRENENGLMAVSYIAPFFDTIDLENFFEGTLTSEELMMDVAETGGFKVRFRGIVDGKEKNFPQNLDHKIILLQEPTCLDPRVNIAPEPVSKFKIRGKISE